MNDTKEQFPMDAIVNLYRRSQLDEERRPSREEAEAAVRTLIKWAGDNPDREGLIDTPKRVVKAYEHLYKGYGENPNDYLDTVFEEVEGYSDIVVLRDITFHSHCEHHMVPFVGKAHIAYYPKRGVIGLSKFARVVDTFARRLQTQEALTAQIAAAIEENGATRGVAIMIEASHMCVAMRGVEKEGVSTITTLFTGIFKSDPAEQVKFMTLIRGIR